MMSDAKEQIMKLPGLKSSWIDPVGTFHATFKFDNDYGASVISGLYSSGGAKGLFELAVLFWHTDGSFSLVYDTPITDDVLGYLTADKVKEKLEEISKLNKDNCFFDWDEYYETLEED